jgi:hypothetical protein
MVKVTVDAICDPQLCALHEPPPKRAARIADALFFVPTLTTEVEAIREI